MKRFYNYVSGGERGLGVPALIEYPFYDTETQSQKFPFRTGAMIVALFTQLITSFFTRNFLGKGYFPRCCDVLSVYSPGKSKDQPGVVQSSSGAALMDTSSVNVSLSNPQYHYNDILYIHFRHENATVTKCLTINLKNKPQTTFLYMHISHRFNI